MWMLNKARQQTLDPSALFAVAKSTAASKQLIFNVRQSMKFLRTTSIIVGLWIVAHSLADDHTGAKGESLSYREQISRDAYFEILHQALVSKYPGPCENLTKHPSDRNVSIFLEIEAESPITRVEIRCWTGYHFSAGTLITGAGGRSTGAASALGGRVLATTFDYVDGTIARYLKFGALQSSAVASFSSDPFLKTYATWVESQSQSECRYSEADRNAGQTQYLDRQYFHYLKKVFRISCPSRSGVISHEILLRQYEDPTVAIVESIRIQEAVP